MATPELKPTSASNTGHGRFLVIIAGLLISLGIVVTIRACGRALINTPQQANTDEAPRRFSASPIQSAFVYSWKTLPPDIKVKIADYNAYWAGGTWQAGEMREFDKKKAYYVRAIVDNRQLAYYCQSEIFNEAQLLQMPEENLYGEYRNRWAFRYGDDMPATETNKIEGFDLIKALRLGEDDEVWIGPIPEKPNLMKIIPRGSRIDDTLISKLKDRTKSAL